MSLFLNSNNELRSGWKFAAYVMFFLILWVATGLFVTAFVVPRVVTLLQDQLIILALNQIALIVPAILAMWLTVSLLDHRPLRTFGIGFLPHWRQDVMFGLAISAGMLAVMIGGSYAFGFVVMRWTGGQVSPGVLVATLSLLLVAAASEELVFRGFPLQLLIDGLGKWPGMIAMSTLFGALHLSNPNASLLGMINTILAGIVLSLAYVKTRSLWLPYGIHAGWNIGLGFVFGFPLSGIDLASLWTTGTAGSETILGGGYGPEGGLLTTFVFLTAALIVEKHGSNNSTETSVGSSSWRNHRDRAGDA